MPALALRNGDAVARAALPPLAFAAFRDWLTGGVRGGARLAALYGEARDARGLTLVAVLAHDQSGWLAAATTAVGATFPALTPDCAQAQGFEREIAEQWGVEPLGHPWLRPVRGGPPLQPGAAVPAWADFYAVQGEEVHEVAVGPIHASVIEPGHFRLQCYGERVLHLEIALGYQHRGLERALIGGPGPRAIHYAETLAGDTTAGHALAYCGALEALAHCQVPARAQALRGVALELERLANHVGDLGALAGDVGYLPTAAFCGRLRGDFLNMTAVLCGSRFGRGFVRPGGVGMEVGDGELAALRARLGAAMADLGGAVELLWATPSVQARFEGTGGLTPATCRALGLVGPAARACGQASDVRNDHPWGIYQFAHIPVATWHSGDVFARAWVRWLECQRSAAFIADQLAALPDGPARVPAGALRPEAFVVSLVEGWRGRICHAVSTDASGRFARYKIVDPSFHNWMGLALALRGQQISDFPLCNKSFNLSYCGHDL